MIALATAATVIASQATISGAYSITRQAVQLDLLPRVKILDERAVITAAGGRFAGLDRLAARKAVLADLEARVPRSEADALHVARADGKLYVGITGNLAAALANLTDADLLALEEARALLYRLNLPTPQGGAEDAL